ncbi:MAG: cell envelope integrity protein CreD [Balneola sp.]|nr:MAG: cell envelope integrity protein CreD [Balneola sp.]
MSEQENPLKQSFTQKNGLFLKITLIVCLTLLMLIPASMVRGLISDRTEIKTEAISEIGEKWGKEQTVIGPILTIPYKRIIKVQKSATNEYEFIEKINQIHILPDELKVNSHVIPQRLNRGIFEVAVYDSQTTFKGFFADFNPSSLGIAMNDLLLYQAFITVGISDIRGIDKQVILNWGNEDKPFSAGSEIMDKGLIRTGIHATTELENKGQLIKGADFSFDLNLKGSDHIYFTPVGKTTQVSMNSSWPSPSFNGTFLPNTDDKHISQEGFKTSWDIIDLNRSYPQQWTNQKHDIKASAFGVDFFIPADNYQRSERSIKYAILFIGLTFLVFFFVEIFNKKAIHPIQYTLVGLALCLFYTLLLSISEYTSFDIAYLLSSSLTLLLVAGYVKAVLKNTRFTLLLSGTLIVLYGFIFIIIQMENLALLTGSLGLFLILGFVMYFSRKIDWYKLNSEVKL